MKKKQFKQVQNQAQEGRSMVEMLGVLAVIGVLSIGGISGYRMAMDRYQANQIANEINLMRTDAKVKTAQGAENLMLGEPYDSGHLNLNSHYGVEFDFAVFSEAGEPEESGYYIKVSGVPAGVCKPLVTLLEGMDDAIAVVVNEQENNADSSADLCNEESNALEVDFSTKDIGVSGGAKECDESTCEGYCSADGACKNCPDDAPWNEATRQCKCSSSQHWNKEIEACAACSDNSHCTSSSKPACIEGVCSACTEESQCDTAQNEHCKVSTGQCITCGKSYYEAAWNEAAQKCDYCKNVDPDTPNWNGSECVSECPADKPFLYSSINQCVKCLNNEHCEKGDGQHYYCETDSSANYGTCTPCPEWDKEHGCKIGKCESNDDCGPGEYCYLFHGYICTSEFDKNKGFGAGDGTYKSECRKAESDINKKGDTNSKYIMSTNSMTWWSAKRFCEALPGNKHMVSATELECKDKFGEDFGYGKSNTGCYCHAEGSEMACRSSSTTDVSSVIKALRKANNNDENSTASKYLWLSDPYGSSDSSCNAYLVDLGSGNVNVNNRTIYYYALCE